jgi:hypothetical protein
MDIHIDGDTGHGHGHGHGLDMSMDMGDMDMDVDTGNTHGPEHEKISLICAVGRWHLLLFNS